MVVVLSTAGILVRYPTHRGEKKHFTNVIGPVSWTCAGQL